VFHTLTPLTFQVVKDTSLLHSGLFEKRISNDFTRSLVSPSSLTCVGPSHQDSLQLGRFDRFGDMIIHTGFETRLFVARHGGGGHGDNREAGADRGEEALKTQADFLRSRISLVAPSISGIL
jgi:hypothetical protein